MNVFIDTCVFLSFYEYSNEDLNELGKLTDYISDEKIHLHLTQQVVQEFQRSRERIIARVMRQLKERDPSAKFPQMCKAYDEYNVLRKKVEEYSNARSSLLEAMEKDIVNETLAADTLMNKLFASTRIVESKSAIVSKAKERTELGNPPGKTNSIGDAVNWETLLDLVEEGQDLYFISSDGDFQSFYQKAYFNPFLEKEWRRSKKSELHFFTSLTAAFKPLSVQISISEDTIRKDAVSQLTRSSSFRDTHLAIERLSELGGSFDDGNLNNIIQAIVLNNQVGWIFWRDDVQGFFWQLMDGRLDDIYGEMLVEFQPWLRESLNLMDQHEVNPVTLEYCQNILDLDLDQARWVTEEDIDPELDRIRTNWMAENLPPIFE